MTSFVAMLAAFAMVLGAVGLLLWQRAHMHAHQHVSAEFVEAQLRDTVTSADVSQAIPATRAASTQAEQDDAQWRHFFLRAGVEYNSRLWFKIVAPGVVMTLLSLLLGGVLSAGAMLLLYAMLMAFYFWLKASKRHRKMVHQLPIFIDSLVRLMSIGNSLGSAFQTAAPASELPLREVLERASGVLQAGLDLEVALHQQARVYRFPELELIAAVVGVAARVGGRADMVLERMGAFMRDLEQAQQELVALSAETRLSAWVMGLLPVALGMFIIVFNNQMFTNMWNDPIGRYMLLGAGGLEVTGTLWMIRLAKSV